MAITSAKVAFDAALAGYYSASYGLIRHMLESWEHIAYIRYVPASARGWYEQEGDRARWIHEPGSSTVIRVLKAGLKKEGSSTTIVDKAENLIKRMHVGAHPSGEGITQTFEEQTGRFVLGATYVREYALLALDGGLYANILLLQELLRLKPQEDAWHSELHHIIARREAVIKEHLEAP